MCFFQSILPSYTKKCHAVASADSQNVGGSLYRQHDDSSIIELEYLMIPMYISAQIHHNRLRHRFNNCTLNSVSALFSKYRICSKNQNDSLYPPCVSSFILPIAALLTLQRPSVPTERRNQPESFCIYQMLETERSQHAPFGESKHEFSSLD